MASYITQENREKRPLSLKLSNTQRKSRPLVRENPAEKVNVTKKRKLVTRQVKVGGKRPFSRSWKRRVRGVSMPQ